LIEEWRLNPSLFQTTLIVTPPSLATQWADELALHAPTLKVLVYEGWSKVDVPIIVTNIKGKKVQHKRLAAGDRQTSARSSRSNTPGMANGRAKSVPRIGKRGVSVSTDAMDTDDNYAPRPDASANDREDSLDWCSYINTFDVCITTYTVLRQDFNVARAAPTRPRRDDVVYSNLQKPRSPLVMVEWWRVIMDEVQMVGGGNSAYAYTLLSFLSAWLAYSIRGAGKWSL
jgi:E3 ubiquitin-protein ligase SHPRH